MRFWHFWRRRANGHAQARRPLGQRQGLGRALSLLMISSVALAGCARVIATVAPPTAEVSALEGGNYALDPDHASVTFKVSHLGYSTYVGRFTGLEAQLDLDPEAPDEARLAVQIETASIDTPSDVLNDKLKDQAMFDGARFPIIRFESTEIVLTGEKTAAVSGLLTIKDVTRPVVLDTRFNGGGTNPLNGRETLGFSATGTLERSAFGLREWLPLVGNEVALEIEAEFLRQG